VALLLLALLLAAPSPAKELKTKKQRYAFAHDLFVTLRDAVPANPVSKLYEADKSLLPVPPPMNGPIYFRYSDKEATYFDCDAGKLTEASIHEFAMTLCGTEEKPWAVMLISRNGLEFAWDGKTYDENRLAFFIAHEIGHAVLLHAQQEVNLYEREWTAWCRKQGNTKEACAEGAREENDWLDYHVMFSRDRGDVLSRFSRDAETEADDFATDLLPRVGLDPAGGADFFRQKAADEIMEGHFRWDESGSHPRHSTRAARILDSVIQRYLK
jgi:hypothetical protein